jgi:hypothetical protein
MNINSIRRPFLIGSCALALSLGIWGAGELEAASTATMQNRYRVTITNVTRGQIFSPALVYSSDGSAPFYELGEMASPELALLAEDGDNSALAATLLGTQGVFDVRSGAGVLMPGDTQEVVLLGRSGQRMIGLAGMLVSTNDAFYARQNVVAPAKGKKSFFVQAYDAGSEANTEDCMYIPGPPCGSGGMHDPQAAEGFIHVHNGVHGGGGLDPALHDWRGPVARVTIERI